MLSTNFLRIWEMLKTSFWFIPIVIVVVAILASMGLIYLDSTYHFDPDGFLSYFITKDVESARTILATIAAAMLNVASIVFSLTLVALTMASSQFGPRLLRNFMNDRLNQTVLGVYVATFIYCLLILRVVRETESQDFIPNISILVTLFVATANIILLIFFIHHVAITIQADTIIADVSKNLNEATTTLYPRQIGHDQHNVPENYLDKLAEKSAFRHYTLAERSGYLQIVNGKILLEIASNHNLTLQIIHRPGDLIVKNMKIIIIYSNSSCDEKILSSIQDAIIVGDNRTPTQDSEFAIHQLVEIIARALSPGINDPFTAITALDKLTTNLSEIAHSDFPSAFRADETGQIRILAKPIAFEGLVNAAFHQVRQYGAENPSVLIRLMESLLTINEFITNDKRRELIQHHADMVLHAAKTNFMDKYDILDIERRYYALQTKK